MATILVVGAQSGPVVVDNDDIGGQVWQYGKVGYVYNDQLVDITYDGTEEVSHHIPTFDVQRAS